MKFAKECLILIKKEIGKFPPEYPIRKARGRYNEIGRDKGKPPGYFAWESSKRDLRR